jgi:hypothetical protein
MMGVADHLERAADLVARGCGVAPALREVSGGWRSFVAAKDFLLERTAFGTLAAYVSARCDRPEVIVEDLRRAAVAARGGEARR